MFPCPDHQLLTRLTNEGKKENIRVGSYPKVRIAVAPRNRSTDSAVERRRARLADWLRGGRDGKVCEPGGQ